MRANQQDGLTMQRRLLRLAKLLAQIVQAHDKGVDPTEGNDALEDCCGELELALTEARVFLDKFGRKRNFLMRLLSAERDRTAFLACDRRISTVMVDMANACAITNLDLAQLTFDVVASVDAKLKALGGEAAVRGDPRLMANLAATAGVSKTEFAARRFCRAL